jgi:hypothetical protein
MQYLTPEAVEQIRALKMQGFTEEQVKAKFASGLFGVPTGDALQQAPMPAMRRSPGDKFLDMATNRVGREIRTAIDIPQDILSGLTGLGQDATKRGRNLLDTGKTALRGEQTPTETAMQIGGNIAGYIFGDTPFQMLKTAGSTFLTPEGENAVAQTVGQGVQAIDQATGISTWYNQQDDRTKRNIIGALGWADALLYKGGITLTKKAGQFIPTPEEVVTNVARRAEEGDVAPAIRINNTTLDDATRTKAVDAFTEAYRSSLVENRKAINDNLEELAKGASYGGTVVKRDDLLRNLAQEGYVPDIEGRLAKFDSSFDDIARRQDDVMQRLNEVLDTSPATSKTDDLYDAINRSLIDNPQIAGGLSRSQAELDRLFSSYRQKYGDTLTARQVSDIRKESNALTRAFKDSDKFSADTASEIGRVTRAWLDENVPDNVVRQGNAEWARLNQLEETMRILNNQQVDVGLLGRALGSYVTTVAGATAGVSVGGPGGLVIAGLLAKIGGDKVADMIRQRIFNPETAAKIREIMQKDRSLLDKLEKTATTQANKQLINDLAGFPIGQRQLPPAQPGAPRSQVLSGAPQTVGGQTPGGRVTTGGTERVREGAVQQPAQTGTLRKQAERFKSVDSFVKAVKNNPAWLKKFEEAGVTPEQIGKMVIGGGTALGLVYLLDNEELSGTGFMVMGSILGGMPARKTFVKQLAKKANEGDLLEMSQFTGAFKEGAFKTNNKGELQVVATKSFTQPEAQQALNDALRRAEDFPVVSNATLKELSDVFEDVLSESGKAKGATPPTTLLEEAKKYKSAELNYVYNTKKAYLGDQDFAQDVEPAGRYMNVGFDEFPGGEGMKTGKVTFKNPLVLEWKTSRTGGWKTDLSERYGGKKGKELSQAIIDDGYDGVIAVTGENPREAVNLQEFRK